MFRIQIDRGVLSMQLISWGLELYDMNSECPIRLLAMIRSTNKVHSLALLLCASR